MIQGWVACSVSKVNRPPKICSSYSLFVPLQEIEAEGILHRTLCSEFLVLIVVTRSERKCPTSHGGPRDLPNMAILAGAPPQRHRLSPFQCLRMFPRSGSIS